MKRQSSRLLITLLSLATLFGCGASSNNSSPTPAEIVAADKAALALGYALGDTSSSVTQNLTLPASGSEGSTITWNSSNAAVISNAGAVNRPLTGDANITLTATIAMSGASDTKVFPVTVKAQMTDAQAVAEAKNNLTIGYADGDANANVTQNLTLTTSGLHNTTVSWSSDNGAIANNGAVSRPDTGDVAVNLTATITLNSASDTKIFSVTVKAQLTDDQAVAAAKTDLAIGYQPGDAETTVTQDLTLVNTGSHGTTVSWSSSDPAIGSDGTVSRPVTGDVPVTLTATISLRASSDTRNFIVTVKAQMTDAEAVAASAEEIAKIAQEK